MANKKHLSGVEDETEVVLAVSNPLLGQGVFVFLKIPKSWRIVETPILPECNSLGKDFVGNGFRWVTSGFIHTTLINEQKNQAYPLSLEIKEFYDSEKVLVATQKRFEKVVRLGELIEMEKININGHEAHYIIWTDQKRVFLKWRKVALVHLEYAVFCNVTKRLMLFRISSSNIKNFMEDKEKMLRILSSLTCHF